MTGLENFLEINQPSQPKRKTDMKKTLLLILTLGLAGASSLPAATVEVFLTGSTAFRANAYTASTRLYVGATPTIYYGDATHGGANSGFSSSTASWVMTGTPITQLTNISGNTLVIHGLFTGSVQGIQTVEQQTPLIFPAPVGTAGANCSAYVTNTPTIGFSDASGSSTPFPAAGNYTEESVAVQPFVVCATSNLLAKISNVSYEQLFYGIPNGRVPLSIWTSKASDTNNFVYLVQRTKDSGTRRVETAQTSYTYNDGVGVYLWDVTNHFWFLPSTNGVFAFGTTNGNIVGPAGLNNVNANWGPGYVGGGDVRAALADSITNAANTAIGYLSISDAKSLNYGGSNWAAVVSFNGFWPTAAGANLHNNTGTNDFTPITLGYYPCWGEEVIVYPLDPSLIGDSKITQFQLGSQTSPGSFIGVFNAQTKINGGSPLVGSIENEIELSKPGGATAIRLSDMRCNRSAVGGIISPF